MEIIHHHLHGKDLHDLCIYLTERLCKEKKYEFLPSKWLTEKHFYPGDPDVYVRVPMRTTDSKGRATHDYMDYIIEVETNISSESIVKKERQFRGSIEKTELIFIDLLRYQREGGLLRDWVALEQFIEGRLPT